MPPENTLSKPRLSGFVAGLPECWRSSFGVLAAGSLAIIVLTWREWGEMVHQWWHIDTYSHILLVPIIIVWLVMMKRDQVAAMRPKAWWPGGIILVIGLMFWACGRMTDINLIAHAGAAGALQGLVIAALGPRVSLMLALPIAFGVFLVPFGDEIIPPLQAITADIAIALTLWSGIPAAIEGIYIDTPVGLFIVAEACSGVRFLIAMVTLAVLVCFTCFDSWWRRALFMIASIIVPVIANGVRAWGTIYIAQSQGVEFAAGFDHIVYGWIFFAIVVAVLLGAAWRYFEREPEDYGWNARDLETLTFVAALDHHHARALHMIIAVAVLAAAAGLAVMLGAPMAQG